MEFNTFDFLILEHFWQFLFLIGFSISLIIFGIFSFLWSTYPDMILDKLSLVKYLGIGASKLGYSNEHIDKGVNHIENIEDKYDEIMDKFYSKTFYPLLLFTFINMGVGYLSYLFLHFVIGSYDSSVIVNLALFISSFIFIKRKFFKGKTNEKNI